MKKIEAFIRHESLEAIHDRLAQLVKPPPGAVRAAVIAGDAAALAAWKESLEPLWLFGDTDVPSKQRPPDKQVPNPWGGTPMKQPVPHPWGGRDMKKP